jgi:hypothetical protein
MALPALVLPGASYAQPAIAKLKLPGLGILAFFNG